MFEAFQRVRCCKRTEGFAMRIPPSVSRLVGLEPLRVDGGDTLVVREGRSDRHANPRGTSYGGSLCKLADAAMGMACASLLELGESFTTIELRMTLLRPVVEGRVAWALGEGAIAVAFVYQVLRE